MAPFMSFEKLLRKYLRLVKPKFILEWGTGHSTRMMLEECPEAEIHTIEHNPKWFAKWHDEFKDRKNVHSYCIPLTENYFSVPLAFTQKGKFNLIFVDGRHRVRCLQVAQTVMDDNGVVILHDSERERYSSGKALFKIIEEAEGTAVMKRTLTWKDHVRRYIELNIKGALHGGEGDLLFDLARQCKGKGVIVEIGSLLGKSTAYLAFGSKAGAKVKVYAIDPFDGGNTVATTEFVKGIIGNESYFHGFTENMRRAKLLDVVTPIPKRSSDAVNDVKEPIELLFINGAHGYEFVRADFLNYSPKVIEGGVIAFHDRNREGVKRVIEEHILKSPNVDDIKTFKTILYCRKKT